MSLYICDGRYCEPNENCAIRYPGLGDCHLTQDISYARKPIRKYYEIIEVQNIMTAISFLADSIETSALDIVIKMGLSGDLLRQYCEIKGYFYDIVIARKLNDIAKEYDIPFRFSPKGYIKPKKEA